MRVCVHVRMYVRVNLLVVVWLGFFVFLCCWCFVVFVFTGVYYFCFCLFAPFLFCRQGQNIKLALLKRNQTYRDTLCLLTVYLDSIISKMTKFEAK